MSNYYSIDLRERVIGFIDEGGSKAEACRIFKIGHNTIYLWIRQRKDRGTIKPKPRGKYKVRLLDDVELSKYVKEHPDATLIEMAKDFSVSHVAIWKALRRLKITRKKKPSVQ
jgi:putative transposase